MDGTCVTYGEYHEKSIDVRRCEHFFGILQAGQCGRADFRGAQPIASSGAARMGAHRSRPASARARPDQLALDLGQATQDREGQAALTTRSARGKISCNISSTGLGGLKR